MWRVGPGGRAREDEIGLIDSSYLMDQSRESDRIKMFNLHRQDQVHYTGVDWDFIQLLVNVYISQAPLN